MGSPVVGGRGSRILGFVAAGSGSGGRGYTCYTGRRRTRKTSLICLHGQAKLLWNQSSLFSGVRVCLTTLSASVSGTSLGSRTLEVLDGVGISSSRFEVQRPSPVTSSLCRTVESRNFCASDVARTRQQSRNR